MLDNAITRVTGVRSAVALAAALTTALVAPPAAAQDVEGTWEGRFRDDGEPHARVQLSADWGRNGYNNITLQLSSTEEGQLVDVALDGDGFPEWSITRDAGTIRLEGRIRNGRGTGLFTFQEDPGFADQMADLGFRGMDSEEIFSAAVLDVGPDRVAELQSMGFGRLSLDDVFAAAIF